MDVADINNIIGTVAQWSEHPTHNRRVVGSNPTSPILQEHKLCHLSLLVLSLANRPHPSLQKDKH